MPHGKNVKQFIKEIKNLTEKQKKSMFKIKLTALGYPFPNTLSAEGKYFDLN